MKVRTSDDTVDTSDDDEEQRLAAESERN